MDKGRLPGLVFILLLTLGLILTGCSSRGEGEELVPEDLAAAEDEAGLAAEPLPAEDGGEEPAPEELVPEKAGGQGASGKEPPEQDKGDAPVAGGEENAPAETLPTGPQEGLVAPDFTLSDPAGETYSLADFRGQAVVMTFWNSGCRYCLWELSFLDTLQREEGVVVLAVNIGDSADTVSAIWKQEGYEITALLDDGTIASEYLVWPIPDNLIIDPRGVIAFRSPGLMSLEDLRQAVAAVQE